MPFMDVEIIKRRSELIGVLQDISSDARIWMEALIEAQDNTHKFRAANDVEICSTGMNLPLCERYSGLEESFADVAETISRRLSEITYLIQKRKDELATTGNVVPRHFEKFGAPELMSNEERLHREYCKWQTRP